MKTIQLKVDDSQLDTFLTIVRNLQNGMVRDIVINDTKGALASQGKTTPWIEEVSDEENAYYVNVFKTMSDEDKSISSKGHVTL